MPETIQELSMADLGQLSLRASVAFSVRCARRLLPMLDRLESEQDNHRAALDLALALADDYARGTRDVSESAEAVAQAAYIAAEETYSTTQFAGYGIAHAAECVQSAVQYQANPGEEWHLEVLAATYGALRVLVNNSPNHSRDLVHQTLRKDFDFLAADKVKPRERLGTAVDPGENGPLGELWPFGTPNLVSMMPFGLY